MVSQFYCEALWRLAGHTLWVDSSSCQRGGNMTVSPSGQRRFSDWNWTDTGWRKGFSSSSGSSSLSLNKLGDTGLYLWVGGSETLHKQTPWCGFERRPQYLLSRKRGGGVRLLEEREWFVERKNGPWEEQMRGMIVYDQICQCLAFTSFFKFTFNWRVSAVRCCVGFSCPTTRISPKCTSALSLSSLPPTSHPVPSL